MGIYLNFFEISMKISDSQVKIVRQRVVIYMWTEIIFTADTTLYFISDFINLIIVYFGTFQTACHNWKVFAYK